MLKMMQELLPEGSEEFKKTLDTWLIKGLKKLAELVRLCLLKPENQMPFSAQVSTTP